MVYYNQLNYAHLKYPAKGYEQATIASSGCGVVCMAMAISNLLGENLQPPQACKIALECGARVPGGTDMNILGAEISKRYGVDIKAYSSNSKPIETINNRNMVICNVKGNVGKYKGIFSDSGHYILWYGMSGTQCIILDPYLYDSKYEKSYRKSVVTRNGNLLYCSIGTLTNDTKMFYTIERKNKLMTIEEALKIMVANGVINSPEYWIKASQCVKYLDELLINIGKKLK